MPTRSSSTTTFPRSLPGRTPATSRDGLLRAASQPGRCRVLCFSPRHDLTLAQMTVDEIVSVVDTWASEVEWLARAGRHPLRAGVREQGRGDGLQQSAPARPDLGVPHVPMIPARKLEAQQRYFEAHGRDLLGDYLAQELARGERLVCRNDHWVALVPFWAVWPFETMLVPVRRVEDLPSLEGR